MGMVKRSRTAPAFWSSLSARTGPTQSAAANSPASSRDDAEFARSARTLPSKHGELSARAIADAVDITASCDWELKTGCGNRDRQKRLFSQRLQGYAFQSHITMLEL